MKSWEDYGISPPRSTHGEERQVCPECSHTRQPEHRKLKCLSINVDTRKWHCHNCGWSGGLDEGNWYSRIMAGKKHEVREYTKPEPPARDNSASALAAQWLQERGISIETAKRLGMLPTTHYFSDSGAELPAIAFPYYMGGELINTKYRALSAKDFALEKGAKRVLWGLDDVDVNRTLIIVEGEMDRAACVEAGITNVVSVPNGAPAPGSNPSFDYLEHSIPVVGCVERFIVATDNDANGNFLADELARILGPERCRRVRFPTEQKDANGCLLAEGPDAIWDRLAEAEEYPIDGTSTGNDIREAIIDLYHKGVAQGIHCGIYNLPYNIIPGQLCIIGGIPSHGKALALDTPIPTPYGWTTMGEIQVGDQVYDECGEVCEVTAATEVMYGRTCYEIVFHDGTRVVCDADHQWLTRDDKARRSLAQAIRNKREDGGHPKLYGTDQSHKRSFPSVKTAREISDSLVTENGKRLNHAVQVAEPISQYAPKSYFEIHPYVLGYWLGDGDSKSGSITTSDKEVLQKIERLGYQLSNRKAKYRHGVLGLQPQLRSIGLLGNKHIPHQYLRANELQRRELLKGLMDSDGSIDRNGRCEYMSTSERLAQDVYELVCSLGYVATIIVGRATIYGRDCGAKYRVCFQADGIISTIPRKQNRVKQLSPRVKHRRIVECGETESVPVRCIQVDSPSHLYLCTGSFIPTHNSTFVDNVMEYLALTHDWHCGIFSPENQPRERHAATILSCKTGMPLLPGPTPQLPEERLPEEIDWFHDHFTFIHPDGDGLESILDVATKLVVRNGMRGLVMDPWNAIEADCPPRKPLHMHIGDCLLKIQKWTREHRVHTWIVAHPRKMINDSSGKESVPTPYDISDSHLFYDRADVIITVWRDLRDGTAPSIAQIQKIRQREAGRVGTYYMTMDPVISKFTGVGNG